MKSKRIFKEQHLKIDGEVNNVVIIMNQDGTVENTVPDTFGVDEVSEKILCALQILAKEILEKGGNFKTWRVLCEAAVIAVSIEKYPTRTAAAKALGLGRTYLTNKQRTLLRLIKGKKNEKDIIDIN